MYRGQRLLKMFRELFPCRGTCLMEQWRSCLALRVSWARRQVGTQKDDRGGKDGVCPLDTSDAADE